MRENTRFISSVEHDIFSVYYINYRFSTIIIYLKKFLQFDWLRAVQFLGNLVPKKEIQCKFLLVFMLSDWLELQS